ncbi:DUF4175 family protein [Lacinutrix sp. Bg11-31]|uniref:DUF4175 family protein n=1 Tax=Lacinutrix sp. Bg11-31 TaxID=2057808 RepID=UPI000C30BFAC|nr:DUF4175 family protein [Lacinutrix sp. Bg11-31]AUC82976.1 hypothetical protein CW733_12905 [Lacinutrix sp. Bg11-31]
MNNFQNIQSKLNQFIRKYYTNELIKGVILFFSIGLLYLLITLLVEHFLWLSSTARTVLFWLFVAVEVALFIKFIAIPLAKLFKLKKGINFEEASLLIGGHFPEVNDKLLNVLQLKNTKSDSELLLASIDQKSAELTPVPFKLAINFKKNAKYLKYAAIPLLIILVTAISGKLNWFSDSYERVINYQTAYEPPAPFQFFVLNEDLQAVENKEFRLIVKTAGDVVPENAQITFNNETYYLQQRGVGAFEFVFEQPQNNITFNLTANNVTSRPYTITVAPVPTLLGFDMVLNYPNYTNKPDEVLKSTGNAVVPTGTSITWKLRTKATDYATLYAKDTTLFKSNENGAFSVGKRVYSNLDYSIATSNKQLKDYENLAFNIQVVRDEYPELKLQSKVDSLDKQSLYFFGKVSDDYGLNKLQLVYYPSGNDKDKKSERIPISGSNFSEFVSAFPNNLEITEGTSYDLYFEVFDNDAVSKNKSTKSSVFSYRKRTADEEEKKQLQEQNETIQDLNKSLDKFEKQQKELEELSKTQKEKSELNFNDKKKFENFIKRQKQQDKMMQKFNKKLQKNLEDFQKENEEKDQFKEDLKERLKENEEQLKADEKLLKELEELKDKINKEEFSAKLEKLAKKAKSQKRSLEQMIELTKRYYVSKKMEKIGNELDKLAKEQDKLANEEPKDNTKEKQEELNKKFEDIQKQLDELEKDNKELKKPVKLPRDENKEENVKDDQEKASEELEKKEESPSLEEKESQNAKAKKKQKSAAQKMKEMSMKMQAQMGQASKDALEEDIEMLRQILDNLVLFSFDEEKLMKQFKSIEINHNEYATYLKKQKDLRTHFEHVDDSLFAMSLRQPKISEEVNKEISDVYFNIDKAMAELAENNIYKGVSSQQYTITSANNLANFLSNALDQLQNAMSMPSPGEGQGEGGMPLPDIIMSQEELNKKMEEGTKKGESGEPKEGEGDKPGEKPGEKPGKGKKPGDKGEDGESGENGKKGKGKKGKDGEGEGEGEGEGRGKDGKGKGGQGKGQDGFNEDVNGELYKIYQQQQMIRQALEEKLAQDEKLGKGTPADAKQLVKQMEDVEEDLINNGFTNETLSKMMNLQHQLLKLEKATLQQGQESKRKSETNKKEFSNTTNNQISKAKEYFNTTEILNKQALPLQQIYKQKVQEYFKEKND